MFQGMYQFDNVLKKKPEQTVSYLLLHLYKGKVLFCFSNITIFICFWILKHYFLLFMSMNQGAL